jgi:UDP-N-acetylmuramyl-tripeptide synthetase
LIRPDSLFYAVKGYSKDGYDFVKQAVDNGAIAVMGERENCLETETYVKVDDIRHAMATSAAEFYGYPGLKIKVCGVTGTNGKTTTCFLIKNILEEAQKKVGLITSLLYDTGKESFDADRTTPESLDIQRMLFLMSKNKCVNAVIEVSSHALVLKRVEHIDFRVAVFTNLSRDHLDFHGTMENYMKAKALLKEKLKGQNDYAVINIDVPEFRELFGDYNTSCMGYSISDKSADVYIDKYDIYPDRTTFDLVTPMGNRTITIKLPGKFNLSNAVAAAAGGLASGVELDAVVSGLEKSQSVPGRLNYVNSGQPFGVYVDYAHTPNALERLIKSVREISNGKIYTLFGCGGDRDKGKRPLMGKAVTENSDFAIVTSDNPRNEELMDIIEDIKPGLVGENYKIVPDRLTAIETILKMAKPNDVVLLAGKGAENYQDIKGVRAEFNDMEEAIKILTQIGFGLDKSQREN